MAIGEDEIKRGGWEFHLLQFQHDLFEDTYKCRSLRQIEDVVDVSASRLSRIKNGKQPDMKTFLKLCNVMATDPADYCCRVVLVKTISDDK